MNYYRHMISESHSEWSHPLLEHGNLLSIGWSDFATTDFITRHQAVDWNGVYDEIKAYGEACGWNPRSTGQSAGSLQRFLQMKKDDKVIVPVPDMGTFHVYEVKSDDCLVPEDLGNLDLPPSALKNRRSDEAVVSGGKLHNRGTGDVIDLGFFREVNLVMSDISRTDYADAPLSRRLMRPQQTTLDVTDLSESIENAIIRCGNKQVINLRSQVMKRCAGDVLDIIEKYIEHTKFEKLICDYLHRLGASVETPSKKNRPGIEGDADVIATFEALRVIIYVQAKRHKIDSKTDDWAKQQIESYTRTQGEMVGDDGYTRIPWVISSAEKFTKECEEGAKSKNIRLINGPEFAEMLLDAGIETL